MTFKKGNTPWNKGYGDYIKGEKHPLYGKHHSEETKAKIKAKRSLQKCSEETRKKMAEARKGKPLSKEIREKISLLKKGYRHTEGAKKRISEGTKKAMSNPSIRKKIKKTQFKKGQFSGEKHPNWNGGASFKPYCYKFNDELKEKIRERDNRTCQLCGAKENGRKLSVHHVHYDKIDCEPDLISLCGKCSSKVNFNRDYYENLFMQILKAKCYK